MRTVIFIVGPTAIGKTSLAVNLARRLGGEIISADSMQVYKGMGILSQAPSGAQKKTARHHLIDISSPQKEYSAALFRNKASKIIDAIIARGKMPIIVGGSGLYIKALVDGLFPSHPADMKFRKRMQAFIIKNGSWKLHSRLARIDPEAARRIHPNDARRIIRALEVYSTTGRTMTELKGQTKGLADRYRIKIFALTRRREDIYLAINKRTDEMFRKGVVAEVKRLRNQNLSKTAMAALGYKEVSGYLNGSYDLECAKETLKMNTRRFAKRQLAWFRADKRIRWFDLDRVSREEVIKRIKKEVCN